MNELRHDPERASRSWDTKFSVILGIVAALVVGNFYLVWKTSQLQSALNTLEGSTQVQFSRFQQNSASSKTATDHSIAELQQQLEVARNQAAAAAGQVKVAAERRARQLVERLAEQHRLQQERVASELGEVKQAADTANEKVTDVMSHVSSVSSEMAHAKSELDKTIADLKSVRGDLGVQSGLIATNARELAALRELGERHYVEFDLAKTKRPQKVGNIAVTVKRTDPKRNKFTLEVIADDKTVEKKDKSLNEPVQFYVSGVRQPYEIVVNEVKKDRLVGYLSIPKLMHALR